MYELALIVLDVIGRWKIFEKSGEEGWKAIIPYYNDYIYCKLADCVNLFWTQLVLGFISLFSGSFLMVRGLTAMVKGFGTLLGMFDATIPAWDFLPALDPVMLTLVTIVVALSGIALIVVRMMINYRFIQCYTSESLLKVLVCVGCIPALKVVLVIIRCLVGLDEKYQYGGNHHVSEG